MTRHPKVYKALTISYKLLAIAFLLIIAAFIILQIPIQTPKSYSQLHPLNCTTTDEDSANTLIIDVATCTKCLSIHRNFSLGSMSIVVEGKQGNSCRLRYSAEVEGGGSVSICDIPQFLKKLNLTDTSTTTNPNVTDFMPGVNISPLLPYCKKVESFNLLTNQSDTDPLYVWILKRFSSFY